MKSKIYIYINVSNWKKRKKRSPLPAREDRRRKIGSARHTRVKKRRTSQFLGATLVTLKIVSPLVEHFASHWHSREWRRRKESERWLPSSFEENPSSRCPGGESWRVSINHEDCATRASPLEDWAYLEKNCSLAATGQPDLKQLTAWIPSRRRQPPSCGPFTW